MSIHKAPHLEMTKTDSMYQEKKEEEDLTLLKIA